jgi:hypothetical protein
MSPVSLVRASPTACIPLIQCFGKGNGTCKRTRRDTRSRPAKGRVRDFQRKLAEAAGNAQMVGTRRLGDSSSQASLLQSIGEGYGPFHICESSRCISSQCQCIDVLNTGDTIITNNGALAAALAAALKLGDHHQIKDAIDELWKQVFPEEPPEASQVSEMALSFEVRLMRFKPSDCEKHIKQLVSNLSSDESNGS